MASLVGDETDSEDEDQFLDNNKQKAKLKKDVDALRNNNNNNGGRRRLRQRRIDQLLSVQEVPENGHCLYIAILRATRDKGLLPGKKFESRSESLNVLNLRQEMIAYLNAGKGEVVRNLRAIGEFVSVLRRIRRGITRNNTLKPSVSREEWGGDPEIAIMTKMYDLDLVILAKEDAIKGAIGNNNITPSTTILVYSNGIHYEWAKVRNWTTFMRQTPAQVQIKF